MSDGLYVVLMLSVVLVVGITCVPSMFRRECPACGARNPLDAKRCVACGKPLPRPDAQ